MDKRLPAARDVFRNLRALHPDKNLDASRRVPYYVVSIQVVISIQVVYQLPLSHLRQENADQEGQQYRMILHRPWKEEPIFDGISPNSTIQFWSCIHNCQTSLGHKTFEELATYALNCLTNPVSDAVAERSFSQ